MLLAVHYRTVKYEKTDNVVPWDVVMKLYKINNKKIDEENLICMISYLKSQGKCKVGFSKDGVKVKKIHISEEIC